MKNVDATFNLSALADRLSNEKRLPQLVGNIRRARDLHSLASDLDMALESLDALDHLMDAPPTGGKLSLEITQSALLNNAIVLYARATKTVSDERTGFDLRARFNDDQKLLHRELCEIRDKAIAHFGSGGSYTGEWQSEVVILQRRGDAAKTGMVTRRQTFDKNLAVRARGQIQLARDLFRTLGMERLGEVTGQLTREAQNNPAFILEVEQHIMSLDAFLASSDAADEARNSFENGFGKGSVRSS